MNYYIFLRAPKSVEFQAVQEVWMEKSSHEMNFCQAGKTALDTHT